MVCETSNVNAAFSFGLFAELLILTLLVLLVLNLFSFGIPKNLVGNLATLAGPLLLLLGVITLASLASDCTDLATSDDSLITIRAKYIHRIDFAFNRGILAILLGALLVAVALCSKFLSKKNFLFRGEAGNKPQPPAATTTTATTPPAAPAPTSAAPPVDTMPAANVV